MNDILIEEKNGIKLIKLSTKATMKDITNLENILSSCDKTPILDLSETDYVDSSFLGLIAKYTMIFKTKNDEYLNIARPTETVFNSLKQTGILKFIVVLDKNLIINGKKIEEIKTDNNTLSKHILELHEILMNLNEDNKKIFAPVVEQMRKVVKK